MKIPRYKGVLLPLLIILLTVLSACGGNAIATPVKDPQITTGFLPGFHAGLDQGEFNFGYTTFEYPTDGSFNKYWTVNVRRDGDFAVFEYTYYEMPNGTLSNIPNGPYELRLEKGVKYSNGSESYMLNMAMVSNKFDNWSVIYETLPTATTTLTPSPIPTQTMGMETMMATHSWWWEVTARVQTETAAAAPIIVYITETPSPAPAVP